MHLYVAPRKNKGAVHKIDKSCFTPAANTSHILYPNQSTLRKVETGNALVKTFFKKIGLCWLLGQYPNVLFYRAWFRINSHSTGQKNPYILVILARVISLLKQEKLIFCNTLGYRIWIVSYLSQVWCFSVKRTSLKLIFFFEKSQTYLKLETIRSGYPRVGYSKLWPIRYLTWVHFWCDVMVLGIY